MAIIDAEVPARPCTAAEWPVLRRMIHASADFELLELSRFHPDAVQAGTAALAAGAVVMADTRMAASGLTRLERLGCTVRCLVDDPRAATAAAQDGVTRSMAAVDLAMQAPPDVWVIGNAPTALWRLLDLLQHGAPRPRLIIGMPVGFVSAAESKDRLVAEAPAPFITVLGRKGGSPLAAAACNALAILAAAQR